MTDALFPIQRALWDRIKTLLGEAMDGKNSLSDLKVFVPTRAGIMAGDFRTPALVVLERSTQYPSPLANTERVEYRVQFGVAIQFGSKPEESAALAEELAYKVVDLFTPNPHVRNEPNTNYLADDFNMDEVVSDAPSPVGTEELTNVTWATATMRWRFHFRRT